MILKRKIYQKLLDWKMKSKGSTALLIKGARRVGKSFICMFFGKEEYRSVLYIDFSNAAADIKDCFYYDSDDLDEFFSKLSVFYNTRLYKRESLIIFDEVQRFPKAWEMIKYLVADGRYDYIEISSIISTRQNIKDIQIPPEDEEKKLEMFPMDFEEFLWAVGNETLFPIIESHYHELKPLKQALHKKAMAYFRQYMLVGGMPQSVLAFLDENNYAASDHVKKRILTLYRNDISKCESGYEKKVASIFETIPSQLSKKEKRFKLSSINKNARLREYEDAFRWLTDSMICNTCVNAADPNDGLTLSSVHSTHKLYMADTGLLVTHAFANNIFPDNDLYKAILFNKLNINEGMLVENIVAQILRCNGHRLLFYSRSDTNNRKNMMEIDFLIKINDKICPVEVKPSAYRHHASLDKLQNKFSQSLGNSYILYTKNLMIKDNIIHLPIYMTMCLFV